jgi:hypothetical protein
MEGATVRRTKGLQITSAVLLVTHFTLINSAAQSALVKSPGSDHYHAIKETATTETNTPGVVSAPLPEESTKLSAPVMFHPSPTALKSRDPEKLGVIDRAYLDAFTILNDENSCSRFFGGSYAITALTELISQLKPRYLDKNIAIKMSGETTTIQSQATGFSFRLFEKAEVNLNGSFFKNTEHSSITSIFRPNTRETRVVVLLHELGHMVKGPGNRWVLTDDGGDISQSLENTGQVVSVCRQQIDSLSKLTASQQLAMADEVSDTSRPPIQIP